MLLIGTTVSRKAAITITMCGTTPSIDVVHKPA
jgi:hypothetical protein